MEAINSILESFKNAVVFRFIAEEAFRAGFCWAAILALIVGMASRIFLFVWNPIKLFFAPARLPAARAGPSPFDQMMSCLVWIVVLMLFIGAVGAAVYFWR